MIPISIEQAGADAGGHFQVTPAADTVTAVVTDTRQIRGGELFVAIAGARVDGATLAGKAIAAGASAVLTATPEVALASGAPADRLIVADDVLSALGSLACHRCAGLVTSIRASRSWPSPVRWARQQRKICSPHCWLSGGR